MTKPRQSRKVKELEDFYRFVDKDFKCDDCEHLHHSDTEFSRRLTIGFDKSHKHEHDSMPGTGVQSSQGYHSTHLSPWNN